MIIVSQDKDVIINFDNIVNLVVIRNTIVSISNIEETTGITIAEYETEKRAKEVLIGIMQAYVDSENYKYVNQFMTAQELDRLQMGMVYEMPSE